MVGTDNYGENFVGQYVIDQSMLQFLIVRPTFTQDDINTLYDVGRTFTTHMSWSKRAV